MQCTIYYPHHLVTRLCSVDKRGGRTTVAETRWVDGLGVHRSGWVVGEAGERNTESAGDGTVVSMGGPVVQGAWAKTANITHRSRAPMESQ